MNRKERAEKLLSGAILVGLGFAASLTKDYISVESGPQALAFIWAVIVAAAGMYYYVGSKETSAQAKASAVTKDPTGTQSDREVRARKERRRPPRRALARRNERPCDPGPHSVDAGRPQIVPLNLHQGDELRGYLEEVDGYNFAWLIVDAENLAKYRQGLPNSLLEGGNDVPADSVKVVIPHDGPWYLVLDAYGKQLRREVLVDLHRA